MFVHAATLHQAALALIAEGVNDCEVSRRLGVPRTTVRDWRNPRYVPKPREVCWRCWRPTRAMLFSDADYAELLGLYLGDGYVCALPRHSHLSCLFPQHGAGKKHERSIVLEPWQQSLLEAEPWAFLRGCIRSDGCVYINRTGKYEYLSYCFDNLSSDIRRLFVDACHRVGVECRPAGTSVRVYRRASVGLMLQHVGVKR
jgi:hypothetical protein